MGKFSLMALPYEADALQPVISKDTIGFHHGKHLAAYVNNLNALLPGSGFEEASLEEIVCKASGGILNNAGQIMNHELYFGQFKGKEASPLRGGLVGSFEGCANLLLFDTKCATHGGSGLKFNWDILSSYRGELPFLLSGGIGPEDAEQLRQFHHDKCIGLDINSRFEVEPGIKDIEAIENFISTIRRHESH